MGIVRAKVRRVPPMKTCPGPREFVTGALVLIFGVHGAASFAQGAQGVQPPGPAAAAEARPQLPSGFHPGVRTFVSLTDNIFLEPDTTKNGGTFVEVSPYLSARGYSPRGAYSLDYQLRNFWLPTEGESSLARHELNGAGRFALVGDRIWLDALAYSGSVSTSATGPVAIDPGAAFVNRGSYRRLELSPYLLTRSDRTTYELRYRVATTGGSASEALARLDQRVSASAGTLADPGGLWNWGVAGETQRREFSQDITLDRQIATGTLGYRVVPNVRVLGTLTWERIEGLFNSRGEDSGFGPGAGIEWTPSARLRATASYGHRYYGPVGAARITYTAGRSTLGFEFDRAINTDSRLSLGTLDAASLTGASLTLPNSIVNALAAQGLTPSVQNAIAQGFMTDAAVLGKRTALFYGLQGIHHAITLTAFMLDESSTGQAAAIPGAFVGDQVIYGFAARYLRRFGARTTVTLGGDARQTRSDSGGYRTDLYSALLEFQSSLTRTSAVVGGLRFTAQRGDGATVIYDQALAYGGLDFRF